MIVQQALRLGDTPEASRRGQQALSPQRQVGVQRIGVRLVAELHGVLENLDKPAGRVFGGNRPNVHDERIPRDVPPLARKLELVGLVLGQGDHVQMRMPEAGAAAPLDLVRPHRPGDAIEHGTPPALLALPQLMLATLEMLETLGEVWSILDRQSHEKGPQSGFLGPDEFPPIQVGFESLSAAPDGAERTEQVLHAQPGTVKLDLVDGVVVPEDEVIAALAQALKLLDQRLRPVGASDIIGNIERL